MQTHETYVQEIAKLAIELAPDLTPSERAGLCAIKLVYGAGSTGLRGVTYYQRWKGKGQEAPAPFVEICAFGQSHWVQIAGTTLHELGHVLAGHEAGHGPAWKLACRRLGLRSVKAAGTEYHWANFAPRLRMALAALPKPDEGEPVQPLAGLLGGLGITFKPRACPTGIGTRGGKSRGVGSGSRLRLFECECIPPIKARVARDEFNATCGVCDCAFHAAGKGA